MAVDLFRLSGLLLFNHDIVKQPGVGFLHHSSDNSLQFHLPNANEMARGILI